MAIGWKITALNDCGERLSWLIACKRAGMLVVLLRRGLRAEGVRAVGKFSQHAPTPLDVLAL